MILPVAMLISAVLITNIAYNTYNRTPPLTISLSSYKDQIVLYRSSSNPESQVNMSCDMLLALLRINM